MPVEGTFDTLADAAECRYPNPDRENRGLCPAHADENNPGLVFRISDDTGNLVVHCFARNCTIEDIADSIGLPTTAFFKDGKTSKFAITHKPEWEEPSVLELLKLIPLGMSFDQQVDAIFRVLESAFHSGVVCPRHDILDIEQPLRHMTLTTRIAYLSLWMEDTYKPDAHDWKEVEDMLLSQLMKLNRAHRTNKLSSGSAIPRR